MVRTVTPEVGTVVVRPKSIIASRQDEVDLAILVRGTAVASVVLPVEGVDRHSALCHPDVVGHADRDGQGDLDVGQGAAGHGAVVAGPAPIFGAVEIGPEAVIATQ